MKKTIACNSGRRVGKDAPSSSTNHNRDENYCGVCSGYFYDDETGDQWVKYLGNCERCFHVTCVESGVDKQLTCSSCL
jgi:hypothetical protein